MGAGFHTAWVFTRTGSTWTEQKKLVGSGASGNANQGTSVALSADGNTLIEGGDTDDSVIGAAWVFTRSGTTWTQQGNKLVGSGYTYNGPGTSVSQGVSVALSGDGNTAMVGGFNDNSGIGATWVFTQSSGTWSQQGDKLIGTGYDSSGGGPSEGSSVSLSSNGNIAIVGGNYDGSTNLGAMWVFTRSGTTWNQQGTKLVGSGSVNNSGFGVLQGSSVALSSAGTTFIEGGPYDNNSDGAVWVFTEPSQSPTATQAIASETLTQNQPATSFTPVTGSGGTAPLSYSVSPSLPTGLSMASGTGTITGTPTVTSAATSYTVTVTDASSNTATASFSLTVNSAVTATQAIASKALTQNHAATSFTPVTGGGGTGTLSYSVSPGLPSGLSMASGTGAITGTPTVTSSATTYTVTVTDANSATASNTFSLTVNSAVTATQAIASKALTQNHAATSFTPVTGGGGTPSLSYSVSPALPSGLSMASGTGAITGTPTVTSSATT